MTKQEALRLVSINQKLVEIIKLLHEVAVLILEFARETL